MRFGRRDVEEGFGGGVADGAFVEVDGVVVRAGRAFYRAGVSWQRALKWDTGNDRRTLCSLDGHVFPKPLRHRTPRLHIAGAEVLAALE